MILYKYRSLSKATEENGRSPREYVFDLLKFNEFYMPQAKDLNDPFDCYMPDTIIVGEHVWRAFADHMGELCGFAERTKTILVGDACGYDSNNYERVHGDKRRLLDVFRKRRDYAWRIFSLSKKNDNILMWAHYSNSFNGICLGFETSVLGASNTDCLLFEDNAFPGHSHSEMKNLSVCYEAEYPLDEKLPIDKITMEDRFFNSGKYKEDLIELLKTKHSQWSYEEEYRLIESPVMLGIEESGIAKPKFKKKILKHIIFGFRCSEEDRQEVKKIVEEAGYPNVSYHECIPKKDEYAVDIVPAIE